MVRASRAIVAMLTLGAMMPLESCIASNLLDSSQRMLQVQPVEREWAPAGSADIEGQFESTEITGAAAGSVLKIYYYFGADGRFTGAALIVGSVGPTFQVLEGQWILSDGRLTLGSDSEPANVYKSMDSLLLTTVDSRVVFKRVTQ